MSQDYARLAQHARFPELKARRRTLTILFPLTLGSAFFALVLAAGLAPEWFDNPVLGGAATLGTVLAVLLMLISVGLNAVYMAVYERRFERLRRQIVAETRQ